MNAEEFDGPHPGVIVVERRCGHRRTVHRHARIRGIDGEVQPIAYDRDRIVRPDLVGQIRRLVGGFVRDVLGPQHRIGEEMRREESVAPEVHGGQHGDDDSDDDSRDLAGIALLLSLRRGGRRCIRPRVSDIVGSSLVLFVFGLPLRRSSMFADGFFTCEHTSPFMACSCVLSRYCTPPSYEFSEGCVHSGCFHISPRS